MTAYFTKLCDSNMVYTLKLPRECATLSCTEDSAHAFTGLLGWPRSPALAQELLGLHLFGLHPNATIVI